MGVSPYQKNEVDLSIGALQNLVDDMSKETQPERVREQVLSVIFLLQKFQGGARSPPFLLFSSV